MTRKWLLVLAFPIGAASAQVVSTNDPPGKWHIDTRRPPSVTLDTVSANKSKLQEVVSVETPATTELVGAIWVARDVLATPTTTVDDRKKKLAALSAAAASVMAREDTPKPVREVLAELIRKIANADPTGDAAMLAAAIDTTRDALAKADASGSDARFLTNGTVQPVTSAKPRVSVTALKYYFHPSQFTSIPFFVITSLPAFTDTSLKSLAQSLLDEYGGLLNTGFSYQGKPLGHLDPYKDFPNYGISAELRGAFRLVETRGSGADLSTQTPMGTGAFTVRYTAGFTKTPGQYNEGDRAGLLTIAVTGAGNYALKSYTARANVPGPNTLGFINLYLSGYLTDVAALSLGGTVYSTSSDVRTRWYFAISANREGTKSQTAR